MVRIVTQILVGLMLFFGVLTLLPKSYFEFRAKRNAKGLLSLFLAVLAFFFSTMAFYYAYLLIKS